MQVKMSEIWALFQGPKKLPHAINMGHSVTWYVLRLTFKFTCFLNSFASLNILLKSVRLGCNESFVFDSAIHYLSSIVSTLVRSVLILARIVSTFFLPASFSKLFIPFNKSTT